jgi:hypothetical protein
MNRLLLSSAALLLLACSDDSKGVTPASAPAGTTTSASAEPPGCERSAELEDDFATGGDLNAWEGPGVDPKTKALPEPEAGGYVVATTRLNLLPEGQKLFSKHVGAILGELQKQPGFVAYQTGFSEKCGVARTLTVWKDEESLYAFVTGPAHKAAIDDTSKMSRGLSNTTHFAATRAADATWTAAAQAIAADDGPFY